MSMLIPLILVSLGVAATFLALFVWAVRSGQYEDTCTPSMRMLLEEPPLQPKEPVPGSPNTSSPALRSSAQVLETATNINSNHTEQNSPERVPMKSPSSNRSLLPSVALAFAALTFNASTAPAAEAAADWKEHAISPVANPLFFESPLIQSEVRPIFIYHGIDNKFIGGFARVFAAELRYAVTERLAIIATKDGFIQLRPNVGALRADGWADIGVGLKYALIDNPEHQFILTPGLKIELPSGHERVFQGNGKGEIDVFVSAMKGWDKFHTTASLGGRVPVDFDAETSSIHYSLQFDYYTCQYFIPFIGANGQTVLSEAKGPAFGGIEGFDLINFGASDAGGFTQIALATGFRSRVCKRADIGFAYEKGVTTPKGLFDDRFTMDFIVRF